MIHNQNNYVFEQDGIIKNVEIYIDGELIDVETPIKLDERINSSEYINFANTEGNMIEFTTHSEMNYDGKSVAAYIVGNQNGTTCRVLLGKFKVYESEKVNDVKNKLTCYDDMQKFNIDVTTFYNSISFPITIRELLVGLCTYCGVEYDIPQIFTNSGYSIPKKPFETNQISGYEILGCINEVSVGYWKVGRDGKLRQVRLKGKDVIYPANDTYPSNDLYPCDEYIYKYTAENNFKELKISDYDVKQISKLIVRSDEQDVGVIVGTGNNAYVITNNFLLYTDSDSALRPYVEVMLEEMQTIKIKPFEATTRLLPFIEVGDYVEVSSLSDRAGGFIFNRSMSLPSGMDEIQSQCLEKIDSNTQNNYFKRTSGKIHKITNTIDELTSTIENLDNGLSTEITQREDAITLSAKNAKEYTDAQVKITSDAITSEVSRAKNAESSLSSSITQTAESISTKVEKNGVISAINQTAESVKISANKIQLSGTTEFTSALNNAGVAYDSDIPDTSDFVTETDLSKGRTTINGGCITTGKIDAKYIDTDNLTVNECVYAQTLRNSRGSTMIDFSGGYVEVELSMTTGHVFPKADGSYKCGDNGEAWSYVYSTHAFQNTSDRRKKKNIDYDVDVSWIKDIKVCEYQLIDDEDEKKQIGVIAQDYNDKPYREYFVNGVEDEKHYLTVGYENISIANVKYTQQLEKRVESLEEKVAKLEELLGVKADNVNDTM